MFYVGMKSLYFHWDIKSTTSAKVQPLYHTWVWTGGLWAVPMLVPVVPWAGSLGPSRKHQKSAIPAIPTL